MDFLGELLALVGMVFVAVFPLVMAFVGARAGSRTSDYYAKTWGTVISLAAMVCLAFFCCYEIAFAPIRGVLPGTRGDYYLFLFLIVIPLGAVSVFAAAPVLLAWLFFPPLRWPERHRVTAQLLAIGLILVGLVTWLVVANWPRQL